MSQMFKKIGAGAARLFNKVTSDNRLMSKINNISGKIDNGLSRVGSFLVPAISAVNPAYGAAASTALETSHRVLNGIEKATREKHEEHPHYA